MVFNFMRRRVHVNRIQGYFQKRSFPALGTRLRPIVAGLTLGIGCLFDAGVVWLG
jgi:hypothetical protein